MNALEHIRQKYNLDYTKKSPIVIPFNRNFDLPALFKELGYKKGAEIGVLEGVFSEILCKELPETTIYSIDPWMHYPVSRNFRPARVYEPIFQRVKEKLSKYPNSIIIRKKSMDALADIPDESLDFVFIDGDHRFEFVTNDIAEWTRKVKKGGIVCGHDFGKGVSSSQYVHTKWVVPAWCEAHNICPWFILDHFQERGWLWVRPDESI